MMSIMLRWPTAAVLLIFLSCQSKSSGEQSTSNTVLSLEDPQSPNHAANFEVSGTEDSMVFKVKNAWPGAEELLYLKTDNIGAVKGFQTVFSKSLEKVVVTSTTHLPFLEMLNVEDKLVGFPGTHYISSTKFRKLVEEGKVTELGSDMDLNIEKIVSLDPDLVIAFSSSPVHKELDKLRELGVPVVLNADYMETTALGRAEWIKFFGALFDEEELAVSKFKVISNRYDSLVELTKSLKSYPTVLSGILYADQWYMPGGNNWGADMIEKAGGDYLWKDNQEKGWLSLSYESVLTKAIDAEYWIGVGTVRTLSELRGLDGRYSNFDAFRDGKVFNYNKKTNPGGGMEFLELGYARPDMVLYDLQAILHPETFGDRETYFYHQLPE